MRVAVFGVIPSLTWRVARCLYAAATSPVVLSRFVANPMRLLPECRRYVPLRGVRWVGGELDERLVDELAAACDRCGVGVLMAADLDATLFVSRHRDRLGGARVSPLPTPAQILELHDKWRFTQTALRLGLPCPASRLVSRVDDVDALADGILGVPFITKPLTLSDGRGFRIHDSVEDARRFFSSRTPEAALPAIAQELLDGFDVGVSFLARDGALIARTMFERHVHNARTFFVDEQLVEYAARFIDATGYSGVGHFDLRFSRKTRDYRFLELNPRFWGSLLYARQAGVNYPALLASLAAPGDAHASAGRTCLPRYERAANRFVMLFERAHHAWISWRGVRLAARGVR